MNVSFESKRARKGAVLLSLLFLAVSSMGMGPLVATATPPVAQAAVTAPMITVTDIEGQELSLAENVAEGKPTVIYFMASWCPICATNWESLNRVVPKYEGSVDFIAISIDPTDTVDVLQKLAEEKGFTFRTSPGNVDAMMQFRVTAQTAKFAIDGEGNIVYRHDGALSEAEWESVFAQLVNG